MKRLAEVFLLSLLLAGCASAPEARAELWLSEPVIGIDEHGDHAVEGVIRNDGQGAAYSIRVEASFYDKQGNDLCGSGQFLDELAAGQSWEYSIPYKRMFSGGPSIEAVNKVSVEVTYPRPPGAVQRTVSVYRCFEQPGQDEQASDPPLSVVVMSGTENMTGHCFEVNDDKCAIVWSYVIAPEYESEEKSKDVAFSIYVYPKAETDEYVECIDVMALQRLFGGVVRRGGLCNYHIVTTGPGKYYIRTEVVGLETYGIFVYTPWS